MINANELRIGNWVKTIRQYDYKHVKFKRFDEDLKVAFFYKEFIGAFIEHVEPIELSPEILEKCGFEKDNSSQYGGYLISIGEGEKIRIVNDESIGWHYPLNGYRRPITNYLHQLQNLYFALTNQELTYDSTK